ncbi:MAG TPA: SAM-dependent methyltransferase [Rhodobiaceae bacterium]|nr:SAM-dependent methyltransferase [Rhodobiaceae bacterium]
MRPAARLQIIAELLPLALSERQPADRLVQKWGRQNRYAGSKDRRDISNRLFAILRHYGNLTARLEGDTPLLVTMLATHLFTDTPLDEVVALADGSQYAPKPISESDAKTLAQAAAETPAERADKLSVPVWLFDDIEAQMGDETEAVLTAMLDRAPLDVRVNLLKADRMTAQAALFEDKIETAPHPKVETALRVSGTAQIIMSRAYKAGLVEVQDAGAQAVAQICAAQPFETVMDFCAGAGGKSLAIAAQMRNKGRLLVHDAIASRMKHLAGRARRAGVEIIESVAPHDLRGLEGQCDLVVADVPCSGTGRWRRAPETKWRLNEEGLANLRELQAQILRQAAALLNPEGRLAYVTCSLLSSENDWQVDKFLEENQSFEVLSSDGPCGHQARHIFHPCNADTDGLYMVVLKRRAGGEGVDFGV